jgi:hypothetical protein
VFEFLGELLVFVSKIGGITQMNGNGNYVSITVADKENNLIEFYVSKKEGEKNG